MNILDRFFLWCFLLPASLYQKMEVDIPQLKAILTAKLTMDNRRPAAFGGRRNRSEKKEVNRATLGTMFGALLMGLFMIFPLVLSNDPLTGLTLFFSMFLFMLCITLITDFTSVLIDVRDNLIILPKPINDKTFVTARLLHITIRTLFIVIPLTLPACILLVSQSGGAVILPFLLVALFSTLLGIFLINAVYLLILQITTPAKFQSVIGSIQIFFAIFLMVGYQLMPRLADVVSLENASVANYPFMNWLPPYWFANACVALYTWTFTESSLMHIALSVLTPLFSIFLVTRYFAPSFNRKLGMITAGAVEQKVAAVRSGEKIRLSFVERLAKRFTKPGSEYMGFVFSWKMMARSRDFKMKVYPSLAYILVFSVLGMFKGSSELAASGREALMPPILLMVTYFSSISLLSALMQLPYTEKDKAAWLFWVSPIENPGTVISGAIKSVLVLFLIPISLILIIVGLFMKGPAVLPNMILGCLNVWSICSIMAYLMVRKLPFSVGRDLRAQGSFIQTMLMLIVPLCFGFLHWALSDFRWVVLFLIVIMAWVPWLVFDEIRKLKWEKLR